MTYLFKSWTSTNIQTWKTWLQRGRTQFVLYYGFQRFFPVFYSASLFGFYLQYKNNDLPFSNFWVTALIMLVTGIAAGSGFALSLWHETNKSYKKHVLDASQSNSDSESRNQ